MLKRLRMTWQMRQRRRQAIRIHRDLASLGYTCEDLERMARLRASLGLCIDEETDGGLDLPASLPPLQEVLEVWCR